MSIYVVKAESIAGEVGKDFSSPPLCPQIEKNDEWCKNMAQEKIQVSVCEAIELCRMINEEGLSQAFALPVEIRAGY